MTTHVSSGETPDRKKYTNAGKGKPSRKSHADDAMERIHKCQFCFKSFKAKKTLEQHVRVHTMPECALSCPMCNCLFETQLRLVWHLRQAHKVKDVNATLGKQENITFSLVLDTETELKGVTETSAGDPKTTSGISPKSSRPLNSPTPNAEQQCPGPDTTPILQQQMDNKGNQPKPGANIVPSKSNTHKASHVCTYCQATFTSPGNLTYHIIQLHPGAGIHEYKCTLCGAVCRGKRGLEKHVKSHEYSQATSSGIYRNMFSVRWSILP